MDDNLGGGSDDGSQEESQEIDETSELEEDLSSEDQQPPKPNNIGLEKPKKSEEEGYKSLIGQNVNINKLDKSTPQDLAKYREMGWSVADLQRKGFSNFNNRQALT